MRKVNGIGCYGRKRAKNNFCFKKWQIHLPFIIKKFAYAAIVFCHGKSIAWRCWANWPNWLNLQANHTHHLYCCFPAKVEWEWIMEIKGSIEILNYATFLYLSMEWSLTSSWQYLHVNNFPQQAARSLQFLLVFTPKNLFMCIPKWRWKSKSFVTDWIFIHWYLWFLLRSYPTTTNKNQWKMLLSETIKQFININAFQ